VSVAEENVRRKDEMKVDEVGVSDVPVTEIVVGDAVLARGLRVEEAPLAVGDEGHTRRIALPPPLLSDQIEDGGVSNTSCCIDSELPMPMPGAAYEKNVMMSARCSMKSVASWRRKKFPRKFCGLKIQHSRGL